MRILMLSSNWPPVTGGGAESYVRRLTEELRAAGHVVAAVTLGIDGVDVVSTVPQRPHGLAQHRQRGRAAQLRFHAADAWRGDARRIVAAAVTEFAPDVVHSHVVTGMSVAALQAPAALGLPHVHTMHDHWLRCLRSTGTSRGMGPCGPTCRVVERARAGALRRHGPSAYVAISDALARAHALLAPVRVLRHPADIAPRGRTRPVGDVPVFGFLGMLNPNKGIGTYLAAATRYGQDARFLVAGVGRMMDAVRAEAAVEYLGWVADGDREAFFETIDCLIVPSTWPEPAGLVVREAAARGIPVIAADVGGLPEYVPSACRPLLFPPGDDVALARRMRQFVDDPSAFLPSADEIPTWSRHRDDLLKLYGEVGAVVTGDVMP